MWVESPLGNKVFWSYFSSRSQAVKKMHSVTPKDRFIRFNLQGTCLLHLERIQLVSFCEIPKWCLLGTLRTAISGGRVMTRASKWPAPAVTVQITSKERVKGQIHLKIALQTCWEFLISFIIKSEDQELYFLPLSYLEDAKSPVCLW